MSILIRDAEPRDEAQWRALWHGYNHFYGATVPADITAHTWQRMLDPDTPMIGRMAERDGAIVGFSVNVLHEGSWVRGPVCYLEDLFVAPEQRGKGIGRRLIEDLIALGRTKGWSGLYWHTRTDNPARTLYDTFVQADDFVRYRMKL